ncbi:eif2 kinase if2k-a (incomplete catalytic triad), partial [Cystoisospora suis]
MVDTRGLYDMLHQSLLEVEDAPWASAEERALPVSFLVFSSTPYSGVCPPFCFDCPTVKVKRAAAGCILRETLSGAGRPECGDAGGWMLCQLFSGQTLRRSAESENNCTTSSSPGCAQGLACGVVSKEKRVSELRGSYGYSENKRCIFLLARVAGVLACAGQAVIERHTEDSKATFVLFLFLPEYPVFRSPLKRDVEPEEERGRRLSLSGGLRVYVRRSRSLPFFRARRSSSLARKAVTAVGRREAVLRGDSRFCFRSVPARYTEGSTSSLVSRSLFIGRQRFVSCITVCLSWRRRRLCLFFSRLAALLTAAFILAAGARGASVLCSLFSSSLKSARGAWGSEQLSLWSDSVVVTRKRLDFVEEVFPFRTTFSFGLPGDSFNIRREGSADEGLCRRDLAQSGTPGSVHFLFPCHSLPFQEGRRRSSFDFVFLCSRDKDRRMRRAAASAPPAAPAGDLREEDNDEQSGAEPPAVSAGVKAEVRGLGPGVVEDLGAAALETYELIFTPSLGRKEHFRDTQRRRYTRTSEGHSNGVKGNGKTGSRAAVSRVRREGIPAFHRAKSFSRLSPGLFAGWSALAARFVSVISLVFLFGLLVWSRDGSRVHQKTAAERVCTEDHTREGLVGETEISVNAYAQDVIRQCGRGLDDFLPRVTILDEEAESFLGEVEGESVSVAAAGRESDSQGSWRCKDSCGLFLHALSKEACVTSSRCRGHRKVPSCREFRVHRSREEEKTEDISPQRTASDVCSACVHLSLESSRGCTPTSLLSFLSSTSERFVSSPGWPFSGRTSPSFRKKSSLLRRFEHVSGSVLSSIVELPASTSSAYHLPLSLSPAVPLFRQEETSTTLEESMSRRDGARRPPPPSRHCAQRHRCNRGVPSSGNVAIGSYSKCGAFIRRSQSPLQPPPPSFDSSFFQGKIHDSSPLSKPGTRLNSNSLVLFDQRITTPGEEGHPSYPIDCSSSWATSSSCESDSFTQPYHAEEPYLPQDSVPGHSSKEQLAQREFRPFQTFWLAERQGRACGLSGNQAARTRHKKETSRGPRGDPPSLPSVDSLFQGKTSGECPPACVLSEEASTCREENLVYSVFPKATFREPESGIPRLPSFPTELTSRSSAAVQCCVRIFAAVEHAASEKMLYSSNEGRSEGEGRGIAAKGDTRPVTEQYTDAGFKGFLQCSPYTEARNDGGVGADARVFSEGQACQASGRQSSLLPPSAAFPSPSGSFSSGHRTSPSLSTAFSSSSYGCSNTALAASLSRSQCESSRLMVPDSGFPSEICGKSVSCSAVSAAASQAQDSPVVAASASGWDSLTARSSSSRFTVAAAAAALAAQSLPGVVHASAAPVVERPRPPLIHGEREEELVDGFSPVDERGLYSEGRVFSTRTYDWAEDKKGGESRREAPMGVDTDESATYFSRLGQERKFPSAPFMSPLENNTQNVPKVETSVETQRAQMMYAHASGHAQKDRALGEREREEGALDGSPSFIGNDTVDGGTRARATEHASFGWGEAPTSSPFSTVSSKVGSPAVTYHVGGGSARLQNEARPNVESSGERDTSAAALESFPVGQRLDTGHSGNVPHLFSSSAEHSSPSGDLSKGWPATEGAKTEISQGDTGSLPSSTTLKKKSRSRNSGGLVSGIGSLARHGDELRSRGERLTRGGEAKGSNAKEGGDFRRKFTVSGEPADAASLAISPDTSLSKFSQVANRNSTEEGRYPDKQGEGSGESRLSSPAPSSFTGDGDSDDGGPAFRSTRSQDNIQSLIVLSVTGDLYHVTTDGSFVWQQSLGSSLATAFDVEPSSSPETTQKEAGDSNHEGDDSTGTDDSRSGSELDEGGGVSEGRRTQIAPAGLGRRLLPAHDGSLFFLDDDGSLTALHVSIPEVVNHLPFQAPLFPHVYFTGEREVSVTALDLNTGQPLTGGGAFSQKKKQERGRGRRRRRRGGRTRTVGRENRAEVEEDDSTRELISDVQTKVPRSEDSASSDFVVESLSLTQRGSDGDVGSRPEAASGVKSQWKNRDGLKRKDALDRSWNRKEEDSDDVDSSEEEEIGQDDEEEAEPRQLQFGVTVWTLWAVDSKSHTTQWGLKWVEVDALGSLSPPPSPGIPSPAVSYLRNILRVDDDKLYLLPSSSSSSVGGSAHASPSSTGESPRPPAVFRSSSTTYTGGSPSLPFLPGTSPRGPGSSFTGKQGGDVLDHLDNHTSANAASSSTTDPNTPPQSAPVFLKFPAPIAAVYVVGPPPGSLEQQVTVKRSHPLTNDVDRVLGEGRHDLGLRQHLALPSPSSPGVWNSGGRHHGGRRDKPPASRKRNPVFSAPSSVTLECIIRQWDGGCASLPFSYVPSPHHAVHRRQEQLGGSTGRGLGEGAAQSHLSLTLPPVRELDEGDRRGRDEGEFFSPLRRPSALHPSGLGNESADLASPRMSALAAVPFRRTGPPGPFTPLSALAPVRGYLEDAPRETEDIRKKESEEGLVPSPSSSLSLLSSSFSPQAELADYTAPRPGVQFDTVEQERGRQIRRHQAASRFSTMARGFGAHNFKAPAPVQPIRVSDDYVSLSFLPPLADVSGRGDLRGNYGADRRKDRKRNVSFSSLEEKIEELDEAASKETQGGRRKRELVSGVVSESASTKKAREEGEKIGQRKRRGARGVPHPSGVDESEDDHDDPRRGEQPRGRQERRSPQRQVDKLSQTGGIDTPDISAVPEEGGPHQGEDDEGRRGEGGRSERGEYDTYDHHLYLVPPSPSPFYAATQPPLSFNPVLSPVLSVLKRWLGRLTRSSSRPLFSLPLSSTVLESVKSGSSGFSELSAISPSPGADQNGMCYDRNSLFSLSTDNTTSRLLSPVFPAFPYYSSNNATMSQWLSPGGDPHLQLSSPFSWSNPPHSRTPNSSSANRRGKTSERVTTERDSSIESDLDTSSVRRSDFHRFQGDGSQDDTREDAWDQSLMAWWKGPWGFGHMCLLIAAASAVLLLARLRGSSTSAGAAAVAFALVPFTGGRARWWRFWRLFTFLVPPVLRREPPQEEDDEGADVVLEPPWLWRKPLSPWESHPGRTGLFHAGSIGAGGREEEEGIIAAARLHQTSRGMRRELLVHRADGVMTGSGFSSFLLDYRRSEAGRTLSRDAFVSSVLGRISSDLHLNQLHETPTENVASGSIESYSTSAATWKTPLDEAITSASLEELQRLQEVVGAWQRLGGGGERNISGTAEEVFVSLDGLPEETRLSHGYSRDEERSGVEREVNRLRSSEDQRWNRDFLSALSVCDGGGTRLEKAVEMEKQRTKEGDHEDGSMTSGGVRTPMYSCRTASSDSLSSQDGEDALQEKTETSRIHSNDMFPHFGSISEPANRLPSYHERNGNDTLSDDRQTTNGAVKAEGTSGTPAKAAQQRDAMLLQKDGRRRARTLHSRGRKLSSTSITALDRDSPTQSGNVLSGSVLPSTLTLQRNSFSRASDNFSLSCPPGEISSCAASTNPHTSSFVSKGGLSALPPHSAPNHAETVWESSPDCHNHHNMSTPEASRAMDLLLCSRAASSAPAETPVDSAMDHFVSVSGRTLVSDKHKIVLSSASHAMHKETGGQAPSSPEAERKAYPRKTSDVSQEGTNTASEFIREKANPETVNTTMGSKTYGPSAADSARRSGDVPAIQLAGGRLGGGLTGEGFSAEEWQRLMFRRAGRRCNSVGQFCVYGGGGRGGGGGELGTTRASHDHISIRKPADSFTGSADILSYRQNQFGSTQRGDNGASLSNESQLEGSLPDTSFAKGAAHGEGLGSFSPSIHSFSPAGGRAFPSSFKYPSSMAGEANQLLGGTNISPRTPITHPGAAEENPLTTEFGHHMSRGGLKPLDTKMATLPSLASTADQESKVPYSDHTRVRTSLVSSTVPPSPAVQLAHRLVSSPLITLALSDTPGAGSATPDILPGDAMMTLPPPAAPSFPQLETPASLSTAVPSSSCVFPTTPSRSSSSAFPSSTSAQGGDDNTCDSSGGMATSGVLLPARTAVEDEKPKIGQNVVSETGEALPGAEQQRIIVTVPPGTVNTVRKREGRGEEQLPVTTGAVEKVTTDILVGGAQSVKVDGPVPPVERGIPTDSSLAKLLENGRFERTFCIQKLVGQGGFGVVYEVRHLLEPGHPIYAVKLILLHLSLSEDISLRRDFREVAANRDLYSKHVVRYYTWWCEEPRFLPVTSLGGGRGLADRKALGDGSFSAVSGRGRSSATGKDSYSRFWGQSSMLSEVNGGARRGRSPSSRNLGSSREERQRRRKQWVDSQGGMMWTRWYWRGSAGGEAYSPSGSRFTQGSFDVDFSVTRFREIERRGRSRERRSIDRRGEEGFPGSKESGGRRIQEGNIAAARPPARRRRETADAADLQVSSRASRHGGASSICAFDETTHLYPRRRHSVPHGGEVYLSPSVRTLQDGHVPIPPCETLNSHLSRGPARCDDSSTNGGQLATAFLRAASAPRRNREEVERRKRGQGVVPPRRSKSFSPLSSSIPSRRPPSHSDDAICLLRRSRSEDESSEDNSFRCCRRHTGVQIGRQRSDVSSLFSGEREVTHCPECGEEVPTGLRTPQRRAFSTPPWKHRQTPLDGASSPFLFGVSEEETGAVEALSVQGGIGGGGHAGKRFLLCGGDSFSDTECTYSSSQGKAQGSCSCELKKERGERRRRGSREYDDGNDHVDSNKHESANLESREERTLNINREEKSEGGRRRREVKKKEREGEREQSAWSPLDISFDMDCYLNTQERDMIVFEDDNST